MTFWICSRCGVEHEARPSVCALCADERELVPVDGQSWTTLDDLAADGHSIAVEEMEPDLFGLGAVPDVGIGPVAKIVRTAAGNLMFDVPSFLDDAALDVVRDLGGLAYIVASHPHMYGVQVEWSRRLGGVPILVSEADAGWLARTDDAIEPWSEDREVLPGLTLAQPGGHFPGSVVAHWAAGADGRGALLSGDTVFANADRTSASFMRSYPNLIPLSGAVVRRIAENVGRFTFDRLYSNFRAMIPTRAREAVLRSAERHAAWADGKHDHLT